MKSFTSKVSNTCKLKLHFPLEIMNGKVFPELINNYEISGVINCDSSDRVTHVDKNKGSADSVYTPNNVINFHSHPISAYNGADTVWGWPSGEDIRETIKFSMNGNKAHLVFTVEGLYTIQVSPCKIKKIKDLLNDLERGILIFAIEEYFKSTHNFRGVSEVNKLNKSGIFINPYSFVDFVNTFDITNLLSSKKTTTKECELLDISKTGHTGVHSEENNNIIKYSGLTGHQFSKIPNMGFPEISGNHITNIPLHKYIDSLDDLRSINKNGNETGFKCKLKDIVNKLQSVETKFDGIKCNTQWNNNVNSWFFVNFFPSNYYTAGGYRQGNKFITPPKKLNITLNHEPFIRIFSNTTDGCTVNTITNNFFRISKFGKTEFGKTDGELNYLLKIIN